MKTNLIAALLVCVAIGSAFAAPANAKPKSDDPGPSPSGETSGDDKKTLPGTVCRPQLGDDDNFEYAAGIRNKTNGRKGVICPILRDHVSQDSDGEIDRVRVYVERYWKAELEFLCTIRLYSLVDGSMLAGVAASTYGIGYQVLDMGPLDYNGGAMSVSYTLTCLVPAQSRVLGIYWEEDLGTDGEGE